MDDFEDCLLELHSLQNDQGRVKAVFKRITRYFLEDQTPSTTDLLLYLTFGENGILKFLLRTPTGESTPNEVLYAFELIEFLLVNFEKACSPYVVNVTKVLLTFIMGDAWGKVKEKAIVLMKYVFAPSLIIALDIVDIMKTIKNYLLETKEMPPSVEGQLYSLLGVILVKAPETAAPEKDFLLQTFVLKLGINSKSILNGCFEGIHGYLTQFKFPNEATTHIVYDSIKRNCSSEVSRRVTGRAVLQIITHHYSSFAVELSKDVEFWNRELNEWLKLKGEDRRLGFSSLVSLYRAITYLIDELNQDPVSLNLNALVTKLLNQQHFASKIGLVELISSGHVEELLVDKVLYNIVKPIRSDSMYLPINLECLSKYLPKCKSTRTVELLHLRRIAVSLIDEYPRMDLHFQQISLQALEKSFYNMSRAGKHEFEEYAREVIYQGLIRSCSHLIWTDAELQKEITGDKMLSHKSYVPVWRKITNLTDLEGAVPVRIFDEYVSSFLRIIKKLDFRIEVKDITLMDPELGFQAIRPKDFQIFINNVNMFEDVATGLDHPHFMTKWLMRMFNEMIGYSYRYPLVSGFYKVIGALFTIAKELEFFNEQEEKSSTLQIFLKDVSVKLMRYKGDLQISCFQMLLAAPVCLIQHFISEFATTFKVILRIGIGHFPLLKSAINALEKWHNDLPKKSMDSLLRNVLPYFDLFLQSKGMPSMKSDSVAFKWKHFKSKGRVRRFQWNETESQLLALQRKFLLFLGNLDQEVCHHLIRPFEEDEDCQEEGFGKDLVYDLPLIDTKIRLYLEEWIPRIIDLSVSCGERSTRITACEFLHTVILITLGSMKLMNGELNGLFRKLVNVCLGLGCDPDHVVFQIFEPLLMQMAHYFSGKERNFSETQIFINCLMDAVSHPYNASLRDFSAKLIREFAEWSIKDHSEESRGTSKNINAILRVMYSLALHPDHGKRCGAAVVFNNIYNLIREEANLLNTHWFQLYYYFMECLNMCSEFDDTTPIENAIEHIKRPLREKDFNESSAFRITPPGFKGNTLSCLLEWTFTRCYHVQTLIRKLSMNLIEDLTPRLKTCSSVEEFVKEHIKDPIRLKPILLKENPSENEYLDWLQHCLTLFHYYTWVLSKNVILEVDFIRPFLENFAISVKHFQTPGQEFSYSINSVRASAITQFLEYLFSCQERGILAERNSLELIKTCLYRPGSYSYEFSSPDHPLWPVLKKILPGLINSLGKDALNLFKNDEEFKSWLSRLSILLQSKKSLTEIFELVNGLKITRELRLWDADALGNLSEKISGDDIVKIVFESLFSLKRRTSFALLIEPNSKLILDDLVAFGMEIGVSMMTLVDIMKKEEVVTEEETYQITQKGEYFLMQFRVQMYEYIIKNGGTFVPVLLNEFVRKSLDLLLQVLRYSHKSELSLEIVENFLLAIDRYWSDFKKLNRRNLLDIVLAACLCSPGTLSKAVNMREWVLALFSEEIELEDLKIAFDAIPYLPDESELEKALECYFIGFFDSENDAKVIVVYSGLLNAFKKTGSLSTLRFLLKIITKYRYLLSERDVDNVTENVSQSNDQVLSKILEYLHGETFNERNPVAENFLQKMISYCRADSAKFFLLEKVIDLVKTLQEAENLRIRISALRIMQICVVKMSREELEALSDDRKEAFRRLLLSCSKITEKGGSADIKREYACECFNTLCTVILAKTDDPALYRTLIFGEDLHFLSLIVSQDREYNLSMDFDEFPKKRKVLTNLRKRITAEKQVLWGRTVSSVKYLQEQTLFSSSLQQDVTRFDFTHSLVRSVDTNGTEIELEMDRLNAHECMATFVGVVRHLVETSMEDVCTREVPFWLEAMRKAITSFKHSRNEKIFILKLIHNIGEYVKPYAPIILTDLLNAILSVFCKKPLNYLVIDLIVMVQNWDWQELNKIDAGIQWTELAIYIINNSDSFRKDIIKSNLEVAKLIIESNRDMLRIQQLSQFIYQRIRDGTVDSESFHYINCHFAGILLSNSIPAWVEGEQVEFLDLILEKCRSTDKNGILAAEVCGFMLKFLENDIYIDALFQRVRKRMESILINKNDNDLSLLFGIHKSYPKISSFFISYLYQSAWTLPGEFRLKALEMILSHMKRSSSLVNEHCLATVETFIEDLLSSEDPEILNLTLQVLTEVVKKKDRFEKLDKVIAIAFGFEKSRNEDIRKSIYAISEELISKWSPNNLGKDDLVMRCRSVLLSGINDSNRELSEKCLNYWYERTRGPSSGYQFSEMMDQLYEAEVENEFLNFASRIMIRSAVNSEGYPGLIFEHPLSQNTYCKRMNLLVTAQLSTVAPMFAESFSSHLTHPRAFKAMQSNFLQQSLLFQPTQIGSVAFSGSVLPKEATAGKTGKRFVRDPEKIRAFFAKKYEFKRKTDLEKEEERVKKLDDHVEILKEYSDGEIPNIQITHSDVLKPLEALIRRDPQIGRMFLTSLYEGFRERMSEDELSVLYEKIGKLIRTVTSEGAASDPTVVAFLFHVLLKCDGRLIVDPECIAKFAKSSGWLSVGGLLMEDILTREETNYTAKKRRKEMSTEEKAWSCYEDLCRGMKEFEVARGIFLDKLRVVGDASEALRSEAISDWSTAAHHYGLVLKTPNNEAIGSDFYVEPYLNCLARLSDWEQLSAYIHETYTIKELWSDSLCEKVLPLYVKSELVKSLTSGDNRISELIADLEKTEHNSKHFVQELALAHYSTGSYKWSNYYLHQYYLDFLSHWSHWNKWSNNLRSTRLIELQIVAELQKSLSILNEKSETIREREIEDLPKKWKRNEPGFSDDLMAWDLKLKCRRHFLSIVQDSAELTKPSLLSELQLVKCGLEQNNFRLAKSLLDQVRIRLHDCGDLRLKHFFCERSLETIQEEKRGDAGRLVEVAHRLIAEMSHIMDTDSNSEFLFESNMLLWRIMRKLNSHSDREAVVCALTRRGLQDASNALTYLKRASQAAENVTLKSSVLLSETYLKIAEHHREHDGYSRNMVKALFRSMSLGNSNARQLFCCVLNDPRLANDWAADEELKRCFEEVPLWMLLTWTNQIFANLDSVMFLFLKDLIVALEREYPEAIRYCFALSKDTYNTEECRQFVNKINCQLTSQLHSNLLTAISYVAPPDLILRHYLENITKLAENSEWSLVDEGIQKLQNLLFGEELQRFRGPIFDILLEFKPRLEQITTLEPKFRTENLINLLKAASELQVVSNRVLKSYSPWLQSFSANLNGVLEIPGQYTGEYRPIPKRHVTISSFKYNVLVMNSKCRPIRVTIIGNDAKEYKFLIKFGEDLRQDQRIQLVFRHMNHIMREHRRLYLDTYRIVPLKNNLGMIQWVDNVVSVSEMLTGTDESVHRRIITVQREYMEFLSQNSTATTAVAAHLYGYLKIGKDRAIAKFNERASSFDSDLLRKSFWRLCSTPDQFVQLRSNFALSQAVIYIAHWILGIGDRHLENTLVSKKTGRALGIDFGLAFGYGTKFLTPPELLPFRLTPQILNLLRPMRESGIIKETMIQCLRIFRKNYYILLAILEVFVTEPSLDWCEQARKDQKSRSGDEASLRSDWKPRKNVETVREKLEGANPVRIFRDDLMEGHSGEACLEKYLEVLLDGRDLEDGLNETDQVSSLLDLATDLHILSKTYVGWNPWL